MAFGVGAEQAVLEGWHYSCLIPLLPLAGAVLVGLFLRVLGGGAHWPVILGVGGALAVSLSMWINGATDIGVLEIYRWIPTGLGPEAEGAAWFSVSFLIDPLTIVMLLTVTGVSTLVVIYSVGYMREHDGHPDVGASFLEQRLKDLGRFARQAAGSLKGVSKCLFVERGKGDLASFPLAVGSRGYPRSGGVVRECHLHSDEKRAQQSERPSGESEGTKCVVLVDGQGVHLGSHAASASPAEISGLEKFMEDIGVLKKGPGRPRTRPNE